MLVKKKNEKKQTQNQDQTTENKQTKNQEEIYGNSETQHHCIRTSML